MRIRAKIRFRTKTIVTSLSRDIHSDLQKIDIILSICNPFVIMAILFESSCLGMGGSKLEGAPTKILASVHETTKRYGRKRGNSFFP